MDVQYFIIVCIRVPINVRICLDKRIVIVGVFDTELAVISIL